MPAFSKQRGFSLVEMLVYISILVLMLGIIMEVVLSVTSSDRIIKATRSIENSAVSGIERIGREMRQSESVVIASSVLGVHPGSLLLTSTDDAGAPRTVEFYLLEGTLRLRENGVDAGSLTEARARVTNLVFHHFTGAESEGIRTEMTIESGTSTHYRTESFYSSSISR